MNHNDETSHHLLNKLLRLYLSNQYSEVSETLPLLLAEYYNNQNISFMALLTKSFSDARRLERNNNVKSLTDFFSGTVQANHNWVEVDSQNLSKSVMDNITDCRIKQGLYGKVLCFTMKDGSARLANWSNQAPDYPAGTVIAPESVTLTRLEDKMTGDWVLRASGEAI